MPLVVNAIVYDQETFNNAYSGVGHIFCQFRNESTIPFSLNDTALASLTFAASTRDDGACVTLPFDSSVVLTPSCEVLWIEIGVFNGRVVSTPQSCDGNAGTGLNSWVAAPGCSTYSPVTFESIGFGETDAVIGVDSNVFFF